MTTHSTTSQTHSSALPERSLKMVQFVLLATVLGSFLSKDPQFAQQTLQGRAWSRTRPTTESQHPPAPPTPFPPEPLTPAPRATAATAMLVPPPASHPPPDNIIAAQKTLNAPLELSARAVRRA